MPTIRTVRAHDRPDMCPILVQVNDGGIVKIGMTPADRSRPVAFAGQEPGTPPLTLLARRTPKRSLSSDLVNGYAKDWQTRLRRDVLGSALVHTRTRG